MEISSMKRKWLAFPLSAGILIVLGIAAGPAFLKAQEEHETPLAKIMEKVNKHNSTITKAVRNKVNFTKSRKDVVKSAKELAKLGKEAKPLTTAIKKAKGVADPQKKWDEYMDEFVKSSEKLSEVADKSDADHQTTKDAFKAVSNSCGACHKDFRQEEGSF
jgi:cytochrome c556